MTDKQIIIDGCDVSGCIYYKATGKYNTCGYDCELTHNCYYKQLKRKEQELNDYKKYWQHQAELGVDTTNRLTKELTAKEQECEELKTLKDETYFKLKEEYIQQLDQLKAEKSDTEFRFELFKISNQITIDQLKAENKELKKQVDITQMFLDACNNSCEHYKQTLTEIKEISENVIKNVSERCIETTPMYGVHKQILQKISECEVNDENE